MLNLTNDKKDTAYLITFNDKIKKVNNALIELIGFSDLEEIQINEFWSLIKLDSDTNSYTVISKSSEIKNIAIESYELLGEGEKLYIFKELQDTQYQNLFNLIKQIYCDGINALGIYDADNFTLVECNEAYLNFLDRTMENTIGKTIFETMSSFNRNELQIYLEQVITTKKSLCLKEYKFETIATEITTYWDISLAPVSISDKLYLFIIANEVTDKVLNRKKVDKQKRQLEAIIEAVDDYICILDKDGKYIKLNKLIRELVNLEKESRSRQVFDSVTCLDFNGAVIPFEDSVISQVMSGKQVENFKEIVQFGDITKYINICAKPVFDEHGNVEMGIIINSDITKIVEKSKMLEEKNKLLEAIIDNISEELYIIDSERNYIRLNNSAKEQYKAFKVEKSQDFHDRFSFYDLLGNKIGIENSSAAKVRNGEEVKDRFVVAYDPKKRYIRTNGKPIFDEHGKFILGVLTVQDITTDILYKQTIEKTLKQQEEFFANISHELKTPLNVIYAAAQLFNMYSMNGSLDEKKGTIVKYISTITQNCYRLSKLVNNIVDISKIEAGFYELNIANHNIVNLIEDIVTSVIEYSESKGINIVFDTDIEEKYVSCDPEKIERVMLNLISNAIKFSDAGDEILIEVHDMDAYIEISVTDNGTGIDKSHLELIFERFKQADKSFSRNAEGTGIGLSLVKAIVELHGGKISVESELGIGSKFTLMLPSTEVNSPSVISTTDIINSNKQLVSIELSDIY